MGYVESVAFFCATIETVKDRILYSLSTRHNAPPHHLKDLADTKPPQTAVQYPDATLEADNNWEALSPHAQATSLSHVKVYLDDEVLVSIWQINSPYHTNVSKCIPSSSVDTPIPLARKVELATNI